MRAGEATGSDVQVCSCKAKMAANAWGQREGNSAVWAAVPKETHGNLFLLMNARP